MHASDTSPLLPAYRWNIFPGEAKRPLVVAGPCSAESEQQLLQTARRLQQQGVGVIRAGLWKPRTSPLSFEGVGERGLAWMQRVRCELGVKVATEVATAQHVMLALNAGIDLLWIGARTTTNPFAVQEIADALQGHDIPVLVKNPVTPDTGLWAGAIERLLRAGVSRIGAVHRGFPFYRESGYRNPPLWQIPIELKQFFRDISLFCDPSHIGGEPRILADISQQSMDLGFDGLMIESHIHPDQALSDARQQITPEEVGALLCKLILREAACLEDPEQLRIDMLRREIDRLDSSLFETVAERLKIVESIGHFKKQHHMPILQPSRWETIMGRMLERADAIGLEREVVEKLFAVIHQAAIDRQTRIMNAPDKQPE